jgi:hypothetical protein
MVGIMTVASMQQTEATPHGQPLLQLIQHA